MQNAKTLDLKEIQQYFKSLGYEVVTIEQKWRHITGHLQKNGQDVFLKLASTPEIAARTKNEVAWNRSVNLEPNTMPVKVPKVLKEGSYRDLFWFASEFVNGKEIAKSTDTHNTTDLEEKMPLIADAAVAIMKLSGVSLMPKDLENPLEPLSEKFLENINGWLSKIEMDISDLFEMIKKNAENLETAPFHGDFVPWHFLLSKSNDLFLVDAEAARIRGIKFYDVAYFFHRTYTKLKRPDLANFFLGLFKKKYQMTEKERLTFRVVLAQRLIGGYLDAQSDRVTSVELQNKLRDELLSGGVKL